VRILLAVAAMCILAVLVMSCSAAPGAGSNATVTLTTTTVAATATVPTTVPTTVVRTRTVETTRVRPVPTTVVRTRTVETTRVRTEVETQQVPVATGGPSCPAVVEEVNTMVQDYGEVINHMLNSSQELNNYGADAYSVSEMAAANAMVKHITDEDFPPYFRDMALCAQGE
jgi:hypothetical protein